MSKFSIRIGTPNRRGFIAASATTAGLTVGSRGRESFAGDSLRKLKIGSSPVVNFAAIYRFRVIAKQYGFDVELINFPSGAERVLTDYSIRAGARGGIR